MIRINCKALSPLAQIDGTMKRMGKPDVISVKKMMIGYPTGLTNENNDEIISPVRVPIYTANGFRGLLRRKASEIIMQKALDANLTITRPNFHLMFAGGGNNYPSADYALSTEIKQLNPIVSLFGTSLAIEGNLKISNFVPCDPIIRSHEKKTGEIYYISHAIGEWENYVKTEQSTRATDRAEGNTGDSKQKKTSIQNIIAKEYIIPGTILTSSISFKHKASSVEIGLLLESLKALALEQLGSSSNIGYGYTEYDIIDEDDNLLIQSHRDPNFLPKCTVVTAENKDISAFNEWLKNLSQKNISIDQMLKPAKKQSKTADEKAS